MKTFITSLLFMFSLACPALVLAQESPAQNQVITEDQAVPVTPVEAAPAADQETVPEAGEPETQSRDSLIREIEDMVERSGKVDEKERNVLRGRIRALRDTEWFTNEDFADSSRTPWRSDSIGG